MTRNHFCARVRGTLVALAIGCSLVPSADAQTDVTASRISGTVTAAADKSNLPGVTIEAKNLDNGLVRTAVTDSNGFYNLISLPTGNYDISATLDGFSPASASGVRLLLGSAPSINFSLPEAKITESIKVTAEQLPVVEITNTSASTTIQTEQIKALPIGGRDFKNLVLLTPESRLDSERGNISISGQRGINTNVTVDGVDYNDPFFGGTVGAAENRAPLSISQESIKEFTVITNGASVEFGRSGGGFVNVITKSGTNAYRGSAFYYNQPQSLISNFANGQEPADQKKDEYGASIGGPVMKDKLFFFASYDKQKQDVTVPITPSVLNPAVFAKYPELSSPDNYVQTRNGDVLFGRVDYQVSESQHFMLRGNQAKYDGENGTSGAASRAASLNGLEGMDSKSFVGQWSGMWSTSWLNDLNGNMVNEDTPRQDKGLGLPEIDDPSATYGEVSFLPITSTTKRKELADTVSYLYKQHVFKAGFDYNDTSVDQIFKGNWRGVFIFNNVNDLLSGRWSQYRQFGGLHGLSSDEAGTADFGQKESALFVQDQWFVRPNLTVTAGVRWEKLNNPDAPVLNPDDRNANGTFNLSAHIPDVNNQYSPRLGMSWSPDNKTAVRFTAGRFWSRTPALLWAQLFTANGVRATQYTGVAPLVGGVLQDPTNPACKDSTGRSCFDPIAPGWGGNFTVPGVERVDLGHLTTLATPGVFAIDPDFQNPYTDRVTVGVEREIIPATSLGLDYTYAEGNHLERLTDINLALDGTTAANGLPKYSGNAGRPDKAYGRITTDVSDGKSKYQGLVLTLNHRLEKNLSYYAALTYSKDKDNDSNERNFSGIQAEDVNNLDLNYGYSNRDQRWKAVVSSLWRTPWWGIDLSGTYRYITGSPYTAITGADTNNDTNNLDRPTVNGVHFDRNSFRQPDFQSLDVRLAKEIKLGPGSLSVFGEVFNLLNSANRSIPVANQTWGTGQTPNASFGKATTPGTPRTIQLSVRYDF